MLTRIGLLFRSEYYLWAEAGVDPPNDVILQREDARQSAGERLAPKPGVFACGASDAWKRSGCWTQMTIGDAPYMMPAPRFQR